MNHNIFKKEKIMVAVFVIFLVTPILASLSYAEFVEHLWPMKTASQDIWYNIHESNLQKDVIHQNPFQTSSDSDDGLLGTQNPYGVVFLFGIFGISVYMVFRSKKMPKEVFH